ncbi:Ubiquitin-like 5 [Perkinsus olseni]|uniref:peptidylprolyl isomerase n=1 Tax=Perkinsus olseni TaxID=32597 RepID=A0A7J6S0X9_PEROL|nr:Ubiquitin-like 5 [Perkinsus olseni]
MSSEADRTAVFIDIDIDSEISGRSAYARGVDFVSQCNLKYGLSSSDITKLGGSEVARLPELYSSDYEWSQKGPAIFKCPEDRITIELYDAKAPLDVENFKHLVKGDKGLSKQSGKRLSYVGCPFHRVVKGFVAQTGDIVTGTGAGGESSYGKKFKDDAGGLKLKHAGPGVVGMCNTGKNSNTSQFYITFKATPQLDGKHVVFGRVASGMEVVERLNDECAADDDEGKPRVPAVIADCGIALRPVRRSHILPGFVNAIWMVMVIWSSLRALHYVPVPIYVVACNARPACTAILEFLVLGKTVPIDRAAALTIIVVGYVIATMSDFAWEGDGVGYAFLYTFLVGGLSVYEHAIMCKLKKEQTPIGLNLYRLVLSLPFLAVMIGVSGEASIAALPLLEGGGLLLIASSVLCLAIGVLMFELQLRASATSMQVFNTVAKFLTTMVSLVTHPADISLSAWTGYFLCVMGFLLYTFGVPRLRPRNKEPLEFDRVFESKGQDGR